MKKLEDDQIEQIAKKALHRSHGNAWRGYEYAKREIDSLLKDEPPQAFDDAARRLADALRI